MTTGSTDVACTSGGQTVSYTYDSSNRLASLADTSGTHTYGYDTRGNVSANRDGAAPTFDLANRMIGYHKGTAQNTYVYDAKGRRAKTINAAGTTYSVYSSSGKLIYEQGPSSNTSYIYLNGQLIAKQGASGTTYIHTDHLGSPVVQSDALGTASNQAEYKPFGAAWFGGTTSGIGFTGHYNDSDTGLTYMQARYYDPVAARFISADPVRLKGGFSLYAYVVDNPMTQTDPTGTTIHCADSASDCGKIATYINKLAKGTYKFDKNGDLQMTNAKGKGSSYYQTRINEAIKADGKISISIGSEYTDPQTGRVENVDTKAGGAVTINHVLSPDASVIVSGNTNNKLKSASGESIPGTPDYLVVHELVGHAIPLVAGGDTGNAVSDENKVRAQIPGGGERKPEIWHGE
jgi:RHS repeat-associated protein